MRKLVGSLIGVIILVLVSYFVTGIITERTLKKDINLINQNSGLQVALKHYQRGWFTSDAVFDWLLVVPARTVTDELNHTRIIPAQTYTIVMPLNIYHGPVLFTKSGVHFGYGYAKTSIKLPAEYLQQFNELFTNASTQPTIDLSVLINYLNRSRFMILVPDFKLISKEDGSQFEWHGMKNVVVVSSRSEKVSGDLEIEGFAITKEKKSLNFKDIESSYNLHKSAMGLYLGEAKVSFNSVVARDKTHTKLDLQKFEIKSKSDVHKDLFTGSIRFSFDKLAVNNKVYGPLLFKMNIKNLDAEALTQINNKVSNIQAHSNHIGQQILWTVLPDLPKLFNKGAIFEIPEARIKLPEGDVNFNLLFKLEKGDLDNPMQLMQKLKGQGKLVASKPVLNAMMYASIKQQLIQKALSQQTKLQTDAAREKRREDAAPVDASSPVSDTPSLKKPEGESMQPATTPPATSTSATNDNAKVDQAATVSPRVLHIDYAEIEREAAATVEQRIKTLLETGALVEENNKYVMNFKYENGELLVNNRPFDPTMLTL